MFSVIVGIVVTLIIVGLILWAIDQMPWISADVKKMIHILVIIVAVLWVLGLLFPGFSPIKVH
jgi:hypothetical protein